MSAKYIIKADKLVADVRCRVSDSELLAKYQLTEDQLRKVLEKLVEKRSLRMAELEERGVHFDDPVNRNLTRRTPRYYLRVPLRVARGDTPLLQGIITDLSEFGFRTRGIRAQPGQVTSFQVRSTVSPEEAPVTITAVCRWTGSERSKSGLLEAGFEILAPSRQTKRAIQRMIKRLGWGDRNLMWSKSCLGNR